MEQAAADYDPRYLAGILLFNRRDFFEAHDVWEELWADVSGPERRFYQALIQAAVALYHFGNGNFGGAVKLYRSSRAYMEPYGSPFLGLNTETFWRQMEKCFAPILNHETPDRSLRPTSSQMPVIALEPSPESWPDPAAYVEEDE